MTNEAQRSEESDFDRVVMPKWYEIFTVLKFLHGQNKQRIKNHNIVIAAGIPHTLNRVKLLKVFITWFIDRETVLNLIAHELQPHF